jgi:predicted nucleotidyltransferase component of viral defense system
MTETEPALHDEPNRFREAILHTASETRFGERLIEKDYYCSMILREFFASDAPAIVFKGGTALSKIHAGFYRLSEDLDFAISLEADASRGQRRTAITPLKDFLPQVTQIRAPWAKIDQGLQAYNENRHYAAALSYQSCLRDARESIKIEIGLREPLVDEPVRLGARTLLLDNLTLKPVVPPFEVSTLSLRECYAEKVRAALCRREPAIRDLYDLDYAERHRLVEFSDRQFVALVRNKLIVQPDSPPDISTARVDNFRRQIKPGLEPVLRPEDFDFFDLDRSWDLLKRLHRSANP